MEFGGTFNRCSADSIPNPSSSARTIYSCPPGLVFLVRKRVRARLRSHESFNEFPKSGSDPISVALAYRTTENLLFGDNVDGYVNIDFRVQMHADFELANLMNRPVRHANFAALYFGSDY